MTVSRRIHILNDTLQCYCLDKEKHDLQIKLSSFVISMRIIWRENAFKILAEVQATYVWLDVTYD